MVVRILPSDSSTPVGKIADAEIVFDDGVLNGLKLVGFAIWERRGGNGGRNVTFPARTYSVNGERRSFALLRPVMDTTAQEPLRALILQALAEYEAQLAAAEPTPGDAAQRRHGADGLGRSRRPGASIVLARSPVPTITVRNVSPKVVQSLKALARRHNRSMEQEVRELLEGYVAERRAVLDQIEASWSRQARRPTTAEVDAWLAIGRP